MVRYKLELRNIRPEVVLRTLAEVGGEAISAMQAQGQGWAAWLEPLEAVRLGVITVPRSLLVIEGEDEALVAPIYDHMRRGMMRGGA